MNMNFGRHRTAETTETRGIECAEQGYYYKLGVRIYFI